jgi:hypothetical protein
MLSIHDNDVYAYVVDCEHCRLILHTSYLDGESKEFTDVVFTGVVAHFFEYILSRNILFAIEEMEPKSVVEKYAEMFKESWRYGWPLLDYKGDLSVLQNWLGEHSIRAFDVQSSYGLSGWVLAAKCDFVSRTGPFSAT